MNRADWLRACTLARHRGSIRTRLANLVAAYRSLPPPADPQQLDDLAAYGMYITRDGERIDPHDFFVPLDSAIDSSHPVDS